VKYFEILDSFIRELQKTVYDTNEKRGKNNMKKKVWSRKKISDEFTGLLKADGAPMSRQQVHMMRKKARGICLTCGAPAVGVYCLKHTIAARERMRHKLKYRRRLRKSPSYVLAKQAGSKRGPTAIKLGRVPRSRLRDRVSLGR
jgi:hypothetical protein